jgi:outer membrane protein assembly factor BamB
VNPPMAKYLGAVTLVVALQGSLLAQESPSFQINAQHSGATMFPGSLKLNVRPTWTRSLRGLVTYPLIAQRIVFVSASNADESPGSMLFALDLKNGNTIWEQEIAGHTTTAQCSPSVAPAP